MEKTLTDILSHLNYDVEITLKKIAALEPGMRIINKYATQNMIEQAEQGSYYQFTANILILGDRLFEVAIGLSYFFSKCSNANVLAVVTNYQEAMAAAKEHRVDYLIIAGYQKNNYNYHIIHQLRERANPPHIVMWALLDQCIFYECRKHKIYDSFDREKPLGEFIHFLEKLNG